MSYPPSLLTQPTSFRLSELATTSYDSPLRVGFVAAMGTHDSHPSVGNLALLVFEAVLEVVCVSLPGYILARLGHFDADKQKFLANVNVMIFTPCLIFTKLASQLNARKLGELAIIPVIFVIQMVVSWCVSVAVAKGFRFDRRASNFVTAMGVFGNSNSLPISLVLSLSQTIKGLHWDKIPGDNDDDVGARGILYLLIFQQLGQLVRWSWGYHVLLAPKDSYPEHRTSAAEEGRLHLESAPLMDGNQDPRRESADSDDSNHVVDRLSESSGDDGMQYEPAGRTPVVTASRASPADSESEADAVANGAGLAGDCCAKRKKKQRTNGSLNTDPLCIGPHDLLPGPDNEISSFPRIRNVDESELSPVQRIRRRLGLGCRQVAAATWGRVPDRAQAPIRAGAAGARHFLLDFMNPPLWAMLLAVIVASVPRLQHLFFAEGSFIANSVTSAVRSSGGVAVPLILVVLGANLARNTEKRGGGGGRGGEAETDGVYEDPEEARIGRRLLVASLISRMVLPTLFMAPILALMAKYVPISILDDPIFVIVCFLLTGAPSALQLAQICQLNGVFEGVMSSILFQSYVVWILPSTLVLVMCALEVVEWAAT